MKSIYFKNSNDVGFEVATAKDIIKVQELGLYMCIVKSKIETII